MNDGRTVFSQLISFLPDREFRRTVARYRGDSRLCGLSCWEQFLAMAFAQLTYRESLRDIEACLRALVAALLMETNQEWMGRIYLSMEEASVIEEEYPADVTEAPAVAA